MSAEDEREPVRYRFGSAETLGLVGAARASQCLVVLGGVAAGLATLYALPVKAAPLAVVPVLAAFALAFTPIRGRVVLDWARLRAGFGFRGRRGRRRWHAPQRRRGLPDAPNGRLDLPGTWGRLRIVAAPHAGLSVGVLIDDAEHVASATLLVRVESFALLAAADQERRVAAWGQLLASLARETGGVRRVAWSERTVPAEVDEIAAYFAAERDRAVPLDAPSVISYTQLIDSSSAAASEHECFVSIQIDLHARRREIRQRTPALGSADQAAAAITVDELRLLARGLDEAGVGSVGALPPRLLAAAIRHALDPAARPQLARLAAAGSDEGCAPAQAGPLVIDEAWDRARTDSAWHTTFWVARWPLRDVGSLFLAPLISRTQAHRTISMVAEPFAPTRAHREAERAVVRAEGDQVVRQRHGFLETARQRHRADAVRDREQELADGHALIRFAGYITVSAPTSDELDAACAEVVQAAQHSHLELRRLVGEQAEALAFTLPGLCRGLA